MSESRGGPPEGLGLPYEFSAEMSALFYRVVCTHDEGAEVVFPFDGEPRLIFDADGFGNPQYQLKCPACGFTERIGRVDLMKALAVVAQHDYDTASTTNEAELKALRAIVRMSSQA